MGEFGVSRRTVARDLDFLRDEERTPLEYRRGPARLPADRRDLQPASGWDQPAGRPSPSPSRASCWPTTKRPLHMDMRAVLDKIAESLEGDISIEPDWLSEHVGVLDRVRIDPEVWAQVAGHIERTKAMRADYQSFAGRVRGTACTPCTCSPITATGMCWPVTPKRARSRPSRSLGSAGSRRREAPSPAPPTSTPSATPGKASGSPAVRNRSRCGCSSNRNWRSMSPSGNGTRARSSSTGPMAGSRCGWRQPGGRNSSSRCCPGYPTSRCLPPRACAIESRRSCRLRRQDEASGRTRRSTRTASKLAVGEQYGECKISACLKETVGAVRFG